MSFCCQLFFYKDQQNGQLFVRQGTMKEYRLLNIGTLASDLAPDIRLCLPDFQVVTGRDITNSFKGKSETAMWKHVKANPKFCDVISNLEDIISIWPAKLSVV